jgi:hypothetical protein
MIIAADSRRKPLCRRVPLLSIYHFTLAEGENQMPLKKLCNNYTFNRRLSRAYPFKMR